MKRIIIILVCIAASFALLSTVRSQSLGQRIKRAACEKVCERNYRNCMEADKDAKGEDGYVSDVKDAAKEESCAHAREKCMEKCDEL
ncbi:MAG: hypothetical protein JXN64_06640 [Spirochaetes bacterium]|nr:hypothetical protein [Spirochaetota bacterium]